MGRTFVAITSRLLFLLPKRVDAATLLRQCSFCSASHGAHRAPGLPFQPFSPVPHMPPLLILLVWPLVLVTIFAVCRWGGGTLATHHADTLEAVATLLVGVCILTGLVLVTSDRLPGGTLALAGLAVAVSSGLVSGYARAE